MSARNAPSTLAGEAVNAWDVMSPAALAEGVERGDRAVLARAISLVESTLPRHEELAEELLSRLDARTGGAIRVGLTGVPGAGKSSLIERLGVWLCGRGHRVAVLAVDPTSSITGGSILGDRTRMQKLSAEPRAFIRPSPSGGSLGGVTRRTREVMLLCEAAGFDVVLVETVGVGQSESAVADMTDCFVAIAIPGAGDDLQGIKRGVLELADVVAVNKADGDNKARARLAAHELHLALHMSRRAEVPVLTCSAMTGEGVEGADGLWSQIERLVGQQRAAGELDRRRAAQRARWLEELVAQRWAEVLDRSAAARGAMGQAEAQVVRGVRPSPAIADRVVRACLDEQRDVSRGRAEDKR